MNKDILTMNEFSIIKDIIIAIQNYIILVLTLELIKSKLSKYWLIQSQFSVKYFYEKVHS